MNVESRLMVSENFFTNSLVRSSSSPPQFTLPSEAWPLASDSSPPFLSHLAPVWAAVVSLSPETPRRLRIPAKLVTFFFFSTVAPSRLLSPPSVYKVHELSTTEDDLSLRPERRVYTISVVEVCSSLSL